MVISAMTFQFIGNAGEQHVDGRGDLVENRLLPHGLVVTGKVLGCEKSIRVDGDDRVGPTVVILVDGLNAVRYIGCGITLVQNEFCGRCRGP